MRACYSLNIATVTGSPPLPPRTAAGSSRQVAPRRKERVTPLYLQLYVHLRQTLTEGRLDPALPLPSEPALVRQFGVSRVTVRKTLARLEAEGLIRRVQGLGTFPASDAAAREPAKTNISGLLENLISYDRSTTATNLEWQILAPPQELHDTFGVGPCLRIVRVRRYQGQPISLTTIHVPIRHARLLDREAVADEPIIRVLDRHGIEAQAAEQVITAVPASELAARELGVPVKAPLICMRRLMTDASRDPVLHQESLYAPDRFEYRMTLSRLSVGPVARWTPIA